MFYINDIFKELEKKKQEKILNAAFEEFARYGYKKASTNRIVQRAGISKGMLFYYFNNKKELYDDLIELGIEIIKRDYYGRIDDQERDFIKKFRQAAKIKMEAFQTYPHLFFFFGSAYLNHKEDESSAEILEKLNQVRQMGFSKLYGNIDTDKLRTDIPVEQIYRMFNWFMGGYEKEMTALLKDQDWMEIDYGPYWEDFYQALDYLKVIFYK